MSQEDGQLKCSLRSFERQVPKYAAISYQWGNPSKSNPIIVNGGILKVTTSLKMFFDNAMIWKAVENYLEWPSGWLWIDAICINQDDADERSKQVGKMWEIYEESYTTIIWLGIGNRRLDDAVDLVDLINHQVDPDKDRSIEPWPTVRDGDIPGVTCYFGFTHSYVKTSSDALNAVAELMHLPYWSRAWILQEASAPKRSDMTPSKFGVWLLWGKRTLSWDYHIYTHRLLCDAARRPDDQATLHVNLQSLANPKVNAVMDLYGRRIGKLRSISLLHTLVRCRDSECTDPRDKIYAALGLVGRHA